MSTQPTSSMSDEDFFAKNARLKRPLSPFHIYKIQITMGLSGLHRITGFALATGFYGIGFIQFFASGNFINQLAWVQNNVPAVILLMAKCVVSTSLAYHLCSGVRHLVWDVGYGYRIKQLYTSGSTVLILTLLALISSFLYFR